MAGSSSLRRSTSSEEALIQLFNTSVAKATHPIFIGMEQQIPFGNDRQKSKGKGKKQIPFGNDRQKGKVKGEKQIPFGNDRQKGKGSPICCCQGWLSF